MFDFPVGGVNYKAEKLNAMMQFHIARRLAPFLAQLGGLAKLRGLMTADPTTGEPVVNEALAIEVIEPLVAVLGSMSDTDCEFVINNCLRVTKREEAGGRWVAVYGKGGLMFEDMDMLQMMQITWHVLQGNLKGFMPAPPLSKADGVDQGA